MYLKSFTKKGKSNGTTIRPAEQAGTFRNAGNVAEEQRDESAGHRRHQHERGRTGLHDPRLRQGGGQAGDRRQLLEVFARPRLSRPPESHRREAEAGERSGLRRFRDHRRDRRQTGGVQHHPGTGQSRRRGDYPRSLLGELSADGEAGGRCAGHRSGRHRAGLQDHRRAARSGSHAEDEAGHPLLAEQSYGERLFGRGTRGAGRGGARP